MLQRSQWLQLSQETSSRPQPYAWRCLMTGWVMMLVIISWILRNLDTCLEKPSFHHGLPLLFCSYASQLLWIAGDNNLVERFRGPCWTKGLFFILCGKKDPKIFQFYTIMLTVGTTSLFWCGWVLIEKNILDYFNLGNQNITLCVVIMERFKGCI